MKPCERCDMLTPETYCDICRWELAGKSLMYMPSVALRLVQTAYRKRTVGKGRDLVPRY